MKFANQMLSQADDDGYDNSNCPETKPLSNAFMAPKDEPRGRFGRKPQNSTKESRLDDLLERTE